MTFTSDNATRIKGLRGAAVGGIVGITVWQILSAGLLGLGFTYGLVPLVVYMTLCFLLGMAIERVVTAHLLKRSGE